jgi:hypothetical protein
MTSSFNIHVDNNLTFSNDADATLSVAAVSGTDTVGKNITISGGQGTGTGAGGSLIFQTADGAGSTGSSANALATKMTILDNGYVGIGETSPSEKLEVAGVIKSSVAQDNWAFEVENTTEHEFKYRIYNDGSDNTDATVFKTGLYYNTTENSSIRFYRGSGGDDGYMTFATNGAERMRINTEGNVGIGTGTDTLLARLEIKGTPPSGPSSGSYSWMSIYTTAGSAPQTGGTHNGGANFSIITSHRILCSEIAVQSDDRLKTNEQEITPEMGLSAVLKLKPQIYEKSTYLNTHEKSNTEEDIKIVESGFISQEVFYDCPEMRHLVSFNGDPDEIIETSEDPQQDPDYSSFGDRPTVLNYQGIISFMAAAIKELNTQLNAEKAKVVTLETQIADLLARVTALENP